jgi:cytochrome P450 monooxygenase
MKPTYLHDGLFLPQGVHVCLAAGPISKDPKFIPNPMSFDGFRWCKNPEDRYALCPELATTASSNGDDHGKGKDSLSTPSSFVTVTATNMGFGYGRQACPGRFFAANAMKAIMSRILLDYEFKFVEEGKDGGKRPANMIVGEHIMPSMTSQVLFRKKPMEF